MTIFSMKNLHEESAGRIGRKNRQEESAGRIGKKNRQIDKK